MLAAGQSRSRHPASRLRRLNPRLATSDGCTASSAEMHAQPLSMDSHGSLLDAFAARSGVPPPSGFFGCGVCTSQRAQRAPQSPLAWEGSCCHCGATPWGRGQGWCSYSSRRSLLLQQLMMGQTRPPPCSQCGSDAFAADCERLMPPDVCPARSYPDSVMNTACCA